MVNYLIIAIVVVIAIALGVGLSALVRARNRTTCRLELANLGNIRSRYELRAEEPTGALEFQFMLNGASLPQRQIAQAVEPAQKTDARSLAPQPGPKAEGVSLAASQAQGAAGGVASVLGGAGDLAPGALGARLRQASMQIRKGQYAASRMETVSGQVADLASGMPAPSSTAPHPAGGQPTDAAASLQAWVQTPFVDPGGSLALDLVISRVRAYQLSAGDYGFKLMSRSLEQNEAPWAVQEFAARIAGLSGLFSH